MTDVTAGTTELLAGLKDVLAGVLGDASLAERLSDDVDVVDEVGLDSLQMISFLLAIEDRFDVEVDFGALELDDLRSLRGFAALIRPAG